MRAETVGTGIGIRQCGQLTMGGFSANTIGAFIYYMESRNGGLHKSNFYFHAKNKKRLREKNPGETSFPAVRRAVLHTATTISSSFCSSLTENIGKLKGLSHEN